MKKIVITGSNGFVGSSLARNFFEQRFDVTCLVRFGSNTELIPKECKIYRMNYNNTAEMLEIIEGSDILIHNAASTRAMNWKQFKKVNIDLTEKMLNICNNTKSLKQFVFISSQAAAGPAKDEKHPKKESNRCFPVTMYGKSKLLAENLIKKKSEKQWTIIRPASVYGPGDKDFLQYFKLIKKHLALHIGFKDKYMNLIYIDDLVEMIAKTLGNKKAYNQIFFASDGKTYTLKKFVKSLSLALNTYSITINIPEFMLYPIALTGDIFSIFNKRPSLINREKIKELKTNFWLVNNDKAKNLLGFKSKGNIEHHLETTYKWYKEKGWI